MHPVYFELLADLRREQPPAGRHRFHMVDAARAAAPAVHRHTRAQADRPRLLPERHLRPARTH